MQPVSPKNQERWTRLRESNEFDEVKNLVRLVVEAAGLEQTDLGQSWGITVGSDKQTFLRINCGDYALFDVRDPGRSLAEREVSMALLFEKGKRPSMASRLKWKATGVVFAIQPGYIKKVEGSEIVFTNMSDVDALLKDSMVRGAMRRHAHAKPRRMPTEHYHNPLTSDFFL